jgi:glutathione S-transferase
LLGDTKYIAGQRFTYADIQMGVSLQFLVRLNKIEIGDYPYLNDYIAMLNIRPSFSVS